MMRTATIYISTGEYTRLRKGEITELVRRYWERLQLNTTIQLKLKDGRYAGQAVLSKVEWYFYNLDFEEYNAYPEHLKRLGLTMQQLLDFGRERLLYGYVLKDITMEEL